MARALLMVTGCACHFCHVFLDLILFVILRNQREIYLYNQKINKLTNERSFSINIKMLKSIVKKQIAHNAASLTTDSKMQQVSSDAAKQRISDLAVNEVLIDQNLIDAEEEQEREHKFKNDHVEYLRVARKPLMFGMEENLTYTQHAHMHIQGVVQNFNNKVYGTWDFKSLHLWSMDTGAHLKTIKMMEETRTHCTISAVAFSHKYRLYLVITSKFYFIFFNENYYNVLMINMRDLGAVNFVHFNDAQNQLITAGRKGVFIHNFRYTGKYEAKLAATIDKEGKNIGLEFSKNQKRLLEPIVPWIKGMKVDQKSGIIITWSQGKYPGASKGPNKLGNAAAVSFNKTCVSFNWLNSRPPNGADDGARIEKQTDEQEMKKTIEAVNKLIRSQQETGGIVEGNNEVIKCVEEKTVLAVVIATDITDMKFKSKFMEKAEQNNANVIEIGTKDDLGVWLGRCKYDKQKRPYKIQQVPLFALKDYGDEFESFNIVRNFIKNQKVERQNMTGDLIAQFRDIMDFGEQILDVLVFIDYRYFLISTDEGNIYVFKYVQTGKVEQQKRLIHTYSGHNKHITHLDKMNNFPHLFMSTSLDGTARVWSLETFMLLYTIEIPGTLTFCTILNKCQIVLSQANNQVKVHQLHMIVENYMNSESQVLQLSPSYHTIADKEAFKVGFTISVCQDNSAVIKDIDDALASYDKTTLYPPPSAQTIMKIVYSINLDRLILLLSSSTICIYKRVKETALLEKILDPSEIKDCEMKRAFSQQVTCMEIFNTERANQILPFDTEVLNLRLHESVLDASINDPTEKKEFILLGLSKGAVLLFHCQQLNQLYCRFTVHREEINAAKYLPNTQAFVTVCKEGHMIFWQIGQDRKVNKLRSFRMPADKSVSKLHVMAPSYHRHNEEAPCDRVMVIYTSGESEIFDFEIGSQFAPQEGEDQNPANAHLYLIDNEKQKEHDCEVTGVDSSPHMRLVVTSDIQGNLKIWSLEKRFMREIHFPGAIDSVCFLNKDGDILVAHDQRISKIRYETYWTSSFTHFGFTDLEDPIHLRYKANEATIETEMYDDHVYLKPPPSRTRIMNQEHFVDLFRAKTEDEHANGVAASKAGGEVDSSGYSTLRKTGAAVIKGLGSNRKQSGFNMSDQASSAMDMNAVSSRLADTAMRKAQQSVNPFSSSQDLTQRSSKTGGHLRAASHAIGFVNFLQNKVIVGAGSQLDKAGQQQSGACIIQQNTTGGINLNASLSKVSPNATNAKMTQSTLQHQPKLRARRNSSMTKFQLEDKLKHQAMAQAEEDEKAFQERLKRINGPGNRDAVPRERNPFAQKQVLQPLPGISYLSTSPVYYEMLAKRKKAKGLLNKGLTRRKITENRISGNIMNFNSPTAVNDFSDMELSIDYHTQVSQHKYNQSNFLPLMNLQILSKIPIEQILNPSIENNDNGSHLGMPPNAAELGMNQQSRKSRSNIPFRTNSFGGGFGQSERHGSRNTNRSGKETAASHVTHGSNRHSLVKPIGLEGQHLHAMLQPNNQMSEISQSNGRNVARPAQRTNIMMTGNQIVGGNLQYPRSTRNAQNQQIQLGQNNQRATLAEDGGNTSLVSQFDNSLIIEGKAKMMRSNIGEGPVTDISGNASFMGSADGGGTHKGGHNPKDFADDSQQNMTHIMDNSRNNAQQVSQTTQETSKQVFGSKQGGGRVVGSPTARKVQEATSVGGELASIKEDQNANSGNQINNEGLIQDDSIIENDQPEVMLPKGGRHPTVSEKPNGNGNGGNDYMASPDKAMGLTGDSFADSIMSNHYQNNK